MFYEFDESNLSIKKFLKDDIYVEKKVIIVDFAEEYDCNKKLSIGQIDIIIKYLGAKNIEKDLFEIYTPKLFLEMLNCNYNQNYILKLGDRVFVFEKKFFESNISEFIKRGIYNLLGEDNILIKI